MSGITNKAELMLALLFAGEDSNVSQPKSQPVEGITRLEKLLFLLKKEKNFLSNASEENDFHFFPFKMGPWTNEVYDEIDFLESLGLVNKRIDDAKSNPADQAYVDELFSNTILNKYQKSDFGKENGTETFALTPEGKQKALVVWGRLSEAEKKDIVELKQRFNRMNLMQFLRYVYQKYPEYTSKSEIKDILGIK